MKNVFIFGAGASRLAGAPLMYDFLDRAHKLWRNGQVDNKEAFEDVFRLISDLQSVFAKSYLDVNNIEALFGAIEMGDLIGRLGERNAEDIKRLRHSIITLIVQTLEQSMRFKVRSQTLVPLPPYGNFANIIQRLSERDTPATRLTFSFITFNYDIALDFALHNLNIPFSYCLSSPSESSNYPLLKLHGSLNWGRCQECREIIPWEMKNISRTLRNREEISLPLGTNIATQKHHDKPLHDLPVLIPPTWNKGDYHSNLVNVWQKAADELASAENLFVIGYSLPETDSFFRYLFALGLDSRTRLERLWVVNPDKDGQVEQRFRAMTGRMVENRLRFLNGEQGRFELAIDEIYRELSSV